MSFYTKACCQKSERVLGKLFFYLFDLKSVNARVFPKLLRDKHNLYDLGTAAWQYGASSPSYGGLMGELWRAVAQLIFYGSLSVRQN